MERSDSLKEIASALCKFQGEVSKIKKGSENPFFKSKYATLSDILDVIQEPLSNCGLSLMQLPTGENELQTIIMHTSGEYVSSTYTMKPIKSDPQSIGSCITYQRRYALSSALCLNIDDDDDGNKASGNKSTVNTTDTRKIFSKEVMEHPNFFSNLYKSEEQTKKEGKSFSLKGFIEKYYVVDDKLFNTLQSEYMNYKINNNVA